MCRLGKWVTMDILKQLRPISADILDPRKRHFHEQPGLGPKYWWSAAAIDFRPIAWCDPSKASDFEEARGVRLCLQKPQQNPITPVQVTQEIPTSIMQGQIGSFMVDTLQEAAQDPEEVLKMVRAQYQDALYTSKVMQCFIQISAPLLIALLSCR